MRPHPLLSLVLAALACATHESGTACLAVADGATTCPDPADVDLAQLSSPSDCDNEVTDLLSTEAPDVSSAVFQDGAPGCCYEVEMVDRSPNSECVVGRPFLHEGAPVLAPVRATGAAAGAWAQIGRAEHASIAAFASLALQLLAHGAPTSLLTRVAEAMRDEVRHAELAFELASRLSGERVVAGPFPFPAAVDPRVSLADLAVAAVREGCLGETLSALGTRHAADLAHDPRAREVLLAVADDEDRHAALSWSIVAWALAAGGPEVRSAVVAAFGAPVPWSGQVGTDDLTDWGLLGPTAMRDVVTRGLREVIHPAALALLSGAAG